VTVGPRSGNITPRRINVVRRYAKTGSFNRLAGRSTAPGSEIPEHRFFKRRILFAALAAAAAAPGLIALAL